MIIAIEGIDGSGKTTQAKMLAQYLLKVSPISPFYKHFPVETFKGTRSRTIDPIMEILKTKCSLSKPELLAILMSANRYEMLPWLKEVQRDNRIFVADRYVHSGYVYGTINGCNQDWLHDLDYNIPSPDLVIYIDTPVKIAMERKKKKESSFDADEEFQMKVSGLYWVYARNSSNWVTIDGNQTEDKVSKQVICVVDQFLREFES